MNSVPWDGRAACSNCQQCVGFACPVDAKNGTQNTAIRRAIETRNCRVWDQAVASSLLFESGRVAGLRVFRCGTWHEVKADTVVLACGAIETARLLLHSRTVQEPNGVGNNSDQVGRHLQGHYYPNAFGQTDEALWDGIGPGPTTATLEFNHGNDGVIGGGLLADDFVMLPIIFEKWWRPPGVPRWGQRHKDWMRDGYRRSLMVTGPVHEIPSPESRVQLSDHVTDKFGIPVARLSGTTHPETVRTAAFMEARAKEWLQAAGVREVWSKPQTLRLSGGQHQAGTCRMGHDPERSVVDPWGRVHGHENLVIADGSVHVTNGGFNPVLTIMALAWRSAERLAGR